MGKTLIFLIGLLLSYSYGASVSTVIDTTQLSVGDILRLEVTAYISPAAEITPPETEKEFGNIRVRDWTYKRAKGVTQDSLTYHYLLTTYIPENCTIPPLRFIVKDSSSLDTIYTDKIALTVISQIPSDTVNIKDIRSGLNAGKRPNWLLYIVITTLIILLLVYVIRRIKKRHIVKKAIEIPSKPPYEEALDSLTQLDFKDLISKGMIREYVFELSEIFKRYISRRYNASVNDLTTYEIIDWLERSELNKTLRNKVSWFFTSTDPVKFARYIPERTIIDKFRTEIKDFLDATRYQNLDGNSTTSSLVETATSKSEGVSDAI